MPRVKSVTQSIAENIKGQGRDQNCQAGKVTSHQLVKK
jgi:hypothetical protein